MTSESISTTFFKNMDQKYINKPKVVKSAMKWFYNLCFVIPRFQEKILFSKPLSKVSVNFLLFPSRMIRRWRKLKTKEMFKGRKIMRKKVAVMSQRVEVPATLFFLSNAVFKCV